MDQNEGVGTTSPLLKFNIPMLPPSMNKIYAVLYKERRVVMTYETVKWKSQAKMFVPACSALKNERLKMSITLNGNWYCKNGAVKKIDAPNLTKVLVDAVAEKIGFDDSQVWELVVRKYQSDKEGCDIKLSRWEDEDGEN